MTRLQSGRTTSHRLIAAPKASLPVRRGNDWWRLHNDGCWERWDGSGRVWERRSASVSLPPPPPPPTTAPSRTPAVRPHPTHPERSRLIRLMSTGVMLLVVVGWAMFLRPAYLGGPVTYVIVAGQSMEPGLHTGDLVLARRQDSYGRGDVVAFQVPRNEPGGGSIVIHRMVGGSGNEGWVLQGDNKDEPDIWRPTNEEISGKRWLLIPQAGHLLVLVRSPLAFAVGASLMVFLLVATPGGREERA